MFGLALGWSVILLGLMWYPFPGGTEPLLGDMDLLVHYGLYLITGALFWSGFQVQEQRHHYLNWLLVTFLLALAGEGGQLLVAERTANFTDLAVNFFALASAATVCEIETSLRERLLTILVNSGLFLLSGAIGVRYGNYLFYRVLTTNPTTLTRTAVIISEVALLWLIFRRRNIYMLIPLVVETLYLYVYLPYTTTLLGFLSGVLLSCLWLSLAARTQRGIRLAQYFFLPLVGVWLLSCKLTSTVMINQLGTWLIGINMLLLAGYSLRTTFSKQLQSSQESKQTSEV